MTPAQQLNAKLRLERKLLEALAPFHKAITRQLMREYGTSATIPDPAPWEAQLAGILETHYRTTADTFIPVITKAMPEDVVVTQQELDATATALAAFFAARATEQARLINGTTMEEMDVAVTEATASTGTLLEAAAVAGAVMSRNLIGRAPGIAATETQAAAEATKTTAVDVLLGRQPIIEGGQGSVAEASKQWWSVGDSHVREDHLIADGQEVPVSAPFVVGGQQLMYPGDTSMGATIDNVINCRCIAEYDTAAIAEERRARS